MNDKPVHPLDRKELSRLGNEYVHLLLAIESYRNSGRYPPLDVTTTANRLRDTLRESCPPLTGFCERLADFLIERRKAENNGFATT